MDNDNYNDYNLADDSDFVNDPNASIIKVIGVGGGGDNAVNYMFRQDIPNVNFVVCNTDKQALKMSPVQQKVLLGYNITQGRGAGNDPDVGRRCAEESADDIRRLFQDDTEMVFITAGMGGGTGTGAAPVVARLAREAGMLTIGIVTVPFLFEGMKKIYKALDGAEEMKKHVDALMVINNENIIELYPDFNFFNAFGKADDTLANAARSISEIISEECYINVDFQDVKTTLKDSGTAIISTAYGEGEHRISTAIHNALHSPLLKAHDIYTSKRLLLKFTCSKDAENAIQAHEIAEITQFTSKLPSSIDVKWGIGDNPELGDKVKITVLASGFDVTLRENSDQEGKIIFPGTGTGPEAEPAVAKTVDTEDKKRVIDIYGKEKLTKQNRDVAKMKYAVLDPSQFDDYEVIELIERNPTFTRDPKFNERLKAVSAPAKNETRPHPDSGRSSGISISFDDD
ncbi:MAG: cell division protein FtsZ [Muribaculaceae bacterium]|nr:cell division protein FtsZ [Muribaculaceae bacterium]